MVWVIKHLYVSCQSQCTNDQASINVVAEINTNVNNTFIKSCEASPVEDTVEASHPATKSSFFRDQKWSTHVSSWITLYGFIWESGVEHQKSSQKLCLDLITDAFNSLSVVYQTTAEVWILIDTSMKCVLLQSFHNSSKLSLNFTCNSLF